MRDDLGTDERNGMHSGRTDAPRQCAYGVRVFCNGEKRLSKLVQVAGPACAHLDAPAEGDDERERRVPMPAALYQRTRACQPVL